MSMAGLLLVWAMGQAGAGTVRTTTIHADPAPVLQIGLQLGHDGAPPSGGPLGPFSVASTGPGNVDGYLFGSQTMCALATSQTAPTGTETSSRSWNNRTSLPGWGWIVSGRVIGQSGSSATAEIHWQRLWEHGVRVASPDDHSQTLTLEPGAIVPLDDVTPSAASPCRATSARLAVGFGPLPQFGRGPAASSNPRGSASGFGGRTVGTGSSGTGGVSNVAAGPSSPGEQVQAVFTAVAALNLAARMGADTRGGAALLDANGRQTGQPAPDLRPLAMSSYNAELWLVQSAPAGHEDTTRLIVHVSPDGGAVAFPPVTVTTSRGRATVDVASMLRVLAGPDGSAMLRTAIARQVSGLGAGTSLGATSQVMPLPSASDVISFEMPPNVGSLDPLEGFHFSLRVRIAPAK